DGPDLNDADTPEENPGACVVTALDQGNADWILVTNGRLWRLYSRQAHARATNFYEVDLVEALTASGDTDPNEAFRYWSLFFRPDAFLHAPLARGGEGLGVRGIAGTSASPASCWSTKSRIVRWPSPSTGSPGTRTSGRWPSSSLTTNRSKC